MGTGRGRLVVKVSETALLALLVALAAPVSAQDWPQLQRDAARSGFQPGARLDTSRHTNVPPNGSPAPAWSWSAPEPMRAQPVVAGGLLAIATLRGRVFALDEASGAQRWVVDTGSPVHGSLAIASGTLIVATLAGEVLGLAAADGSERWRTRISPKGISASPTVTGGRVLVGARDGTFAALDLATGQIVWSFAVGGAADPGRTRSPILTPAAVLAGRVFFGAENMHAYALDLQTGALLWARQLRGQSFQHGWPVATTQAGGVVLFRTTPIYSFHDTLNSDESFIQTATGRTAEGNPLGTPADWIVEQRAISERLAANPHRASLWALVAATGADRYALPLPVLYTGGSGGTPAPPVVDDAGGRAWVMCRSVYARFDGMGVRNYGELAKLNLAFDPAVYANAALGEAALGIRFFSCQGPTNCKAAWEDFHKIADEGETLTGAANAIVSSTWVSAGGIDLETDRTFNLRFYSSDDTGSAGLYGSQTGAVIANGRVILRDSQGLRSYVAHP